MAGTFVVTIAIGNDAVQTMRDVAEILRELATDMEAREVEETDAAGDLYDDNGNVVGGWEFESGYEDDEDIVY